MLPWHSFRSGLIATATLFLFLCPAPGQETSRRLILTDGSYQLVTKYEVKGNRVRYFSAEREEWEEIPKSLVDWPATEKYEKDRAAGVPEAVQLDKEAKDDAEMEAALPEVAPGLRLPEDSGVFLLDTYNSEPQLVELQQSEGDVNRNTKGNIFRGAANPIGSAKMTIELEGEHARVQSHVAIPSLYISVDQDQPTPAASQTPPPPSDRFRILRAETKNHKRILGDVKRALTGKVSQEQRFVKTSISPVKGGFLKLTPTEPLASGEYALVETSPDQGFNLNVWDFGVNPTAPANPNPWKPTPPKPSPDESKPK